VRGIATLLLLVLACAALSSCGHTHNFDSNRGRRSTSAAPGGSAARGTLTRPQALALAKAVNLRATDVPGFRVSARHHRETQEEKRLGGQLLRCVGAGGESGLAEAGSSNFERRGVVSVLSVSSNVGVARTSALAAKQLSKLRSGHTRECVSSYFSRLLKVQRLGGTAGPVSIQHGTPPAPGTTGGFAWRISATVTLHLGNGRLRSVPVPFYIDILGFVDGPAEVTLFSFGTPVPFPAPAQQHLYALLLARTRLAGAHS
jgi:hypothetical protein